MQLRGILLHPSLESIARAAVAAVMHLSVKRRCALFMFSVAVEFFFVFEFFSFVKHLLFTIVTQVVTLSKSCYTLA